MKVLTHHLTVAKNPIDAEKSFLSFCRSNEVIFHSENCFSVKNKEGLYLTAFRNENITFHSQKCDSWEKFYILDDEAEKVIDFAINKLKSDYKLFLNNNKLHVLMGNEVITPSFIPPATLKKGEWFIEYNTLLESKRLQVSKPLIYFCIYGKEEYYECFYLAVRSLIEKGKYTGDILIKTDDIEKVKNFTEQFDNYFIFSEINKEFGIFNRYWLHEPCLKDYSSLIYFDSDILVTQEIEDILKNFRNNDLISFIDGNPYWQGIHNYFNDTGSYRAYKWYGMQYINKDYVKRTNEIYVVNSGLFVINNLDKVKNAMDKVVQYAFMEDGHGDQPFFNTILYNSGIDINILSNTEYLGFSHSSYDSFKNLNKTLIHYNSGVGNISKLNLMQETWDYINK